jgi:hypothetical protein
MSGSTKAALATSVVPLVPPPIGTFAGVLAACVLAACSSSSDTPGPSASAAGSDASADARSDGGVQPGADAVARPDTGAALALLGTVKDGAGVPVPSAKIEAAGASVFSDTEGRFELVLTSGGPVVVKVTRNWFKPTEIMVNVGASGVTRQDLTLEEIPLKLDPADAALAERHARTFDWTKDTISISIAARPTRRDFDNAVYFRNPALYRDTSGEAMLVPSPLPEITGGVAKNLTFKLASGRNAGQEALDLASVVDNLDDARLDPAEHGRFMMWTPMVNWLAEWDAAKAADLRAAGVAVRQQTWGAASSRPQEIERVYLDAAAGALWAEVVFAPFVQVGPGITDGDGNGRKEIFARIAAVHHGKDVTDRLAGEYRSRIFTTHGLSKEVTKSLNELYSTATAAQVERYIGDAIDLSGVGRINYPFVVLRHSGGQRNVILVAP